nr:MAG TPA: hypothetical protein [Caudoviricetes sp.]
MFYLHYIYTAIIVIAIITKARRDRDGNPSLFCF